MSLAQATSLRLLWRLTIPRKLVDSGLPIKVRGRSRPVEAHVAFGGTEQRQPATPTRLVAPKHLLFSPEVAPVRRLPIGAEPQPYGGVHFRVWAPRCRAAAVEVEGLEPAELVSRAGATSRC